MEEISGWKNFSELELIQNNVWNLEISVILNTRYWNLSSMKPIRQFERELTFVQTQLSPGSEIRARDAYNLLSSVHTVPKEFEKDVFHFNVDGKTF